jgi:polysaccharide deacetylase family protein (PEP-CTERM system associated)
MNCLSVDVEEFFQAEVFARVISRAQWSQWERRAAPCLERIGELLARYQSQATFFVLGWTVRYLAPLLRQLAAAGHEIACHGDGHEHLSRLSPAALREDLHRARGVLEDQLGICPRGYRAPTFSVTRDTAWALDVIHAAGFEYDASIFPVRHDRYGVPDAPVTPFWVVAPSGARLLEFPPLTLRYGRVSVPVGGGGYLRLLPGSVLRSAVRYRMRRGEPAMIYVHPWELDPGQPGPRVSFASRWRHRVNLHTTQAKLTRLLQAFRFDRADRVLEQARSRADLPVFNLRPAIHDSRR